MGVLILDQHSYSEMLGPYVHRAESVLFPWYLMQRRMASCRSYCGDVSSLGCGSMWLFTQPGLLGMPWLGLGYAGSLQPLKTPPWVWVMGLGPSPAGLWLSQTTGNRQTVNCLSLHLPYCIYLLYTETPDCRSLWVKFPLYTGLASTSPHPILTSFGLSHHDNIRWNCRAPNSNYITINI